MLELIQTITHFANQEIQTVNGVALSKDSLFAISGDSHCIFKFDRNSFKEVGKCGSWGYGKKRFKTPVAIACRDEVLYIADWMNHRVVCLDTDLRFIRSFGFFRNMETTSRGRACVEYVRSLGLLNPGVNPPVGTRKPLRAAMMMKELCQSVLAAGFPTFARRLLTSDEVFFNKPDGVTFFEDYVYISQHYNHSVTKLNQVTGEFEMRGTLGTEHGQFDRPSNIIVNDQSKELFVSDVFNGRIEVLDLDLQYKRTIVGNASELLGHFLPFGLALIGANVLVTCGADSIQLFEIDSGKLIHDYRGDHDQLHGLAYDSDNNTLFAADRLKNRICIFKVDIDSLPAKC